MTALSFGCFTITLRNSARTDVRLTGLFWAGYSFLPFLKTGTMFASFQVTRISTDCQGCWKIIERCPTVTSVSSLSTLGWIPVVSQTYIHPTGATNSAQVQGWLGIYCYCIHSSPAQGFKGPTACHQYWRHFSALSVSLSVRWSSS